MSFEMVLTNRSFSDVCKEKTNHCVGEREGCLGERKRKFVDLRQYGSESVEDDQEHSRHQFKPNFLKFRGCKQHGSGSLSFLKFIMQLDREKIVELQYGDVPEKLGGIFGWKVCEGKEREWAERRRTWFMHGKEGKIYKPNSMFQILRRLGYFPTENTRRASHGLDFENSRTFQWDGSRQTKYLQKKDDEKTNEACTSSDNDEFRAARAVKRDKLFPAPVKIEQEPKTFEEGHQHRHQLLRLQTSEGIDLPNVVLLQSLINSQSEMLLRMLQQQQLLALVYSHLPDHPLSPTTPPSPSLTGPTLPLLNPLLVFRSELNERQLYKSAM